MWVEPNGKVIILSGVPVDPTQTDVPWFASAGAQESFFKGFTLKTYSKVSFMRVNTSVPQSAQGNTGSPRTASTIRVPTNAAELYSANYLMFQNTSYSNKWFYAFVETVNPLSDNATEITYQIDDMQTWQFDFTVGACPLKREHIDVGHDVIGANVEPEPFTCNKITAFKGVISCKPKICALVTTNGEGTEAAEPYKYGSFVAGCEVKVMDAGTASLKTFLNEYVASKNMSAIITMYSFLEPLANVVTIPLKMLEFVGRGSFGGQTWDGGGLKNKKIFTSQFINYVISTVDGELHEFDPEGFGQVDATISINPSSYPWLKVLDPQNYYALSSDTQIAQVSHRKGISLGITIPFGGTSWATDLDVAVSKGILKVAAAALTGGSAGGFLGGMSHAFAAGLRSEGEILATNANPMRSQGVGGDYSATQGAEFVEGLSAGAGIHFGVNAIPSTQAQEIDQFFTYFGYATNDVAVPNGVQHGDPLRRPIFNYVQTDGCIFSDCSCPADSASNIKKIFDKGVRLWHDPTKIGTTVRDNT